MDADFWEKHRTANVVVGFFAGVLILMGGLGGLDADQSLGADAVVTEAVVEDVVSTRDPQYRVRFELPSGKEISTRTVFPNGDARRGDRIKVEYDPEDPKTVAEVGSREGSWALYGGMGLVGLAVSCYTLWQMRRL